MIIFITANSESEARKIVEFRWPGFKYDICQISVDRWEVTLIEAI